MSTDMSEYEGRHRAAMKARTIFGREPAAWVGLIEGVVGFIILLPVASALNIGPEWAVLFMAVVSSLAGLYTAWATKDTFLGAITGFAKAAIGLGAYYGLNLTPELQASLMSLVALLVGFWQRTQTSPVDFPRDPSPQQVVPVASDLSVEDGDHFVEDVAE